ncbi:MAG: putative lipid II flippase FtsW [Coriobacteriia bacterium]
MAARGGDRALPVSTARRLLLGACLLLAFGGLVMVFSAAFFTDIVERTDGAYSFRRQTIYLVLGLALMWFFSRFDYRRLRKLAWLSLLVCDVGLIGVLAFGVGALGARRVIDLGFFSLQPSEFAKLACVLVAAAVMTDKRLGEEWPKVGWVGVALLPVVILVMMQPDMGTAVVILGATFVVMWLGGLSWKFTFGLSGGGLLSGAAAIVLAPYRFERWLAFKDPWADPLGSGYQTIQAIYAFATGGLTGVGLGMSAQKFGYLPEAHTDFILALIGEELGLLGTLVVVGAFAVFAVAGFRIVVGVKDPFGRVLAGGLTSLVVVQALVNMGAVTNLIPVTGIPLPFVSYGGNSMLASMTAVGIILSVARHGGRSVPQVRGERGGGRARASGGRRDGRARVSGTRPR